MSDVAPVAFVVDDGVSLRESPDSLIRSERPAPRNIRVCPRVFVPNHTVLDVCGRRTS